MADRDYTETRLASNGHVMEYRVRGYHPDGTPILSLHDAQHSSKCRCGDRQD